MIGKFFSEHEFKVLKLIGSAIVGFASMIIAIFNIKKENDLNAKMEFDSKPVYEDGGKVTHIHRMDFNRHTEVHK